MKMPHPCAGVYRAGRSDCMYFDGVEPQFVGSWFKKAKRAVKKVVKKAAPFVRKALPIAKPWACQLGCTAIPEPAAQTACRIGCRMI